MKLLLLLLSDTLDKNWDKKINAIFIGNTTASKIGGTIRTRMLSEAQSTYLSTPANTHKLERFIQ